MDDAFLLSKNNFIIAIVIAIRGCEVNEPSIKKNYIFIKKAIVIAPEQMCTFNLVAFLIYK